MFLEFRAPVWVVFIIIQYLWAGHTSGELSRNSLGLSLVSCVVMLRHFLLLTILNHHTALLIYVDIVNVILK